MSNQIANNPEDSGNVYTLLQNQISTSQGMLNEMMNVKQEVADMRDSTEVKFKQMESMVKRVEDSVTITYEEQQQLKSIVGKKANGVATGQYDQSDIPEEDRIDYGAEIRELAGYATRIQWKALKDRFNLARYSSLRRIDFDKGIEFLQSMSFGKNFIDGYKRWQYQKVKKRERDLARLKQNNS